MSVSEETQFQCCHVKILCLIVRWSMWLQHDCSHRYLIWQMFLLISAFILSDSVLEITISREQKTSIRITMGATERLSLITGSNNIMSCTLELKALSAVSQPRHSIRSLFTIQHCFSHSVSVFKQPLV